MGVLLALASSVCYGLADFVGGVLSRRARSTAIAFAGQLGGLLLCLIVAPLLPASAPAWSDLAWGAASGVGTGAGMLFLYRGLSRGAMSVVVPLSAVGGLALPVLVGVVLFSDRPSPVAWVGILLAPPALWCIARRRTGGGADGRAGVGDALLAGAGIALQYPAIPVLLGVLVLRERLSGGHLAGLGAAGVAIWCLTT